MKVSDEQRGPHAAKGGDKPHVRKQDRRNSRSPTLFAFTSALSSARPDRPGSALVPLLSVCALARLESFLPDWEGGESVLTWKGQRKPQPQHMAQAGRRLSVKAGLFIW